VIAITFTKTFGFSLVGALGFYLNAYYVCKGNIFLATKIAGVASTFLFVPNLFAIPICTWIANRWDKGVLLYVTIASGILGSLSMYFLVTPLHPWLQVFPSLLIGPLGIGLWLVVPSMQADVVDYDELMTGQRREGSFSATYSWTLKASTALSGGISGLVLVWTGFDISHGAIQPVEVLLKIKFLSIWIPVVFLVMSIFAVSRYKLTRKRMAEIRIILENRRGVI
jgi:GPH family glycoside/pentoside/hexuronide:cation symporter